MKGQAKPRGHGGTLNQINQTSWETPFALSITFELTDREKKERRSSFARSLEMTAARPSEGERQHEDQLLLSISWAQGGEKAGKNHIESWGMEEEEFRERCCLVSITAVRCGGWRLPDWFAWLIAELLGASWSCPAGQDFPACQHLPQPFQ